MSIQKILGAFLLGAGVAVFAIRLRHPGEYFFPEDGNLRAALLALAVGIWFVGPWLSDRPIRRTLDLAIALLSPVVLFFASYAVLAEAEEVVVVSTEDVAGQPAMLRLWVMDADAAEWVNMPREKAVEHRLTGRRILFHRDGHWDCRVATLVEDRDVVRRNDQLGSEKYAVKRFASAIGVFGDETPATVVSVRLDACAKN